MNRMKVGYSIDRRPANLVRATYQSLEARV